MNDRAADAAAAESIPPELHEPTPGRRTLTARMPASARSIARAVADEMRGGAAPAPAATSGTIYRSAAPSLGRGPFLDEILGAQPPLVARAGDGDVHAGAERHVDHAARGSGHALPEVLRSRFEGSLGADLGGVRIHDDAASATAAAAVGARAYALGQDVFMGAGQYQPSSNDGALLLAHEVAHTVQQRGGAAAPQYKLEVSSPGDAAEVEADHAAHAMVAGAPFAVGAAGAGAALSRWADAGNANVVLAAIARADRATIQQIILAIETARSAGTPGVQLPDRSVTVAIADLHDLERRARARFAAVQGQGAEADHTPAAAPAADHTPAAAPAADHAPTAAPGGSGGAVTGGTPAAEHGGAQPAAADSHAPAPAASNGVQTRERFRQEFDLLRDARTLGWFRLRSIRARIEVYEEQNPVATPAHGERTQVVAPSVTRRAGSPTSVGGQVELPRFQESEFHDVLEHIQLRSNFAPSITMAREGGVMTGNIGIGTLQLRRQNIPGIGEVSFECPVRLIERARTRSGNVEWRILEARPTVHFGPFQIPSFDPFVRVSFEFSVGPDLPAIGRSFSRLLGRTGVATAEGGATAATGAADTAATGAADTAATGAADTAATGAADTAATGAADTAATGAADTAVTGAADTAVTGAADTAVTGAADTAVTGAADTALATGAGEGGATVAAGEGAATTAVGGALIAGGFILGGVATIAATFASLAESDAYFRNASAAQQAFYAMCASYSRVMRGLPPVGPEAAQAAGQRAAQATLARIAAQQHVSVARVQALARPLGGAHFYSQCYDHGQARLRASMIAATERVSGVGPSDAGNRVDALAVGGDLYNRYHAQWPL